MSTYFTPVTGPKGNYPNTFNPVALANLGRFNIISEKIIPHLFLEIRPDAVWRYTFDVAFDVGNERREKFLTQTASGVNWYDNVYYNAASVGEPESFVVNAYNKLYFTPRLDKDKHNFQGIIGFNTSSRNSYSFGANTAGSPSNYLTDPVNYNILSDKGVTSSVGKRNDLNLYTNISYILLDRYIVFGNLAYYGDSRFGKNYRYGLFPAISGRYRISGEPWMK